MIEFEIKYSTIRPKNEFRSSRVMTQDIALNTPYQINTAHAPKHWILYFDKDFKKNKVDVLRNMISISNSWTKPLDEISKLPDNWDDEGSYAIDCHIVEVVRKASNLLNPSELQIWQPVPSANGTISLCAMKNAKGMISVGMHGFSYYIMLADGTISSGDFSIDNYSAPAALAETLRKASAMK